MFCLAFEGVLTTNTCSLKNIEGEEFKSRRYITQNQGKFSILSNSKYEYMFLIYIYKYIHIHALIICYYIYI